MDSVVFGDDFRGHCMAGVCFDVTACVTITARASVRHLKWGRVMTAGSKKTIVQARRDLLGAALAGAARGVLSGQLSSTSAARLRESP